MVVKNIGESRQAGWGVILAQQMKMVDKLQKLTILLLCLGHGCEE